MENFVYGPGSHRLDTIELSNGQLICKAHKLIYCYDCSVDYWGTNDPAESEGDLAIKRGTGHILATKFMPPSPTSTPDDLFRPIVLRRTPTRTARFIRHDDRSQMLIYADGSCFNNGQANPRAGWAFVYGHIPNRPVRFVSGRLEMQGPFGEAANQTNNRAELRAILGALRFRHWACEGIETLVLATDSTYVVEGATTWIADWIHNDWKTSRGVPTKNKDLWQALLGEFEEAFSYGLTIKFWRIDRALNEMADSAAKQAAESNECPVRYQDVFATL